MSLTDLIVEKIKADGPITIAEYMQVALSQPHLGYYMHKDPLGAEGDFTTAPEISQIFGELCGAWLAEQWMHLGMPEDVALIELGPGRGTLMADLLRGTRHIAGFHSAISVHLVETSPVLKQKQWHTLAGKHPHIEWHETIDELPDVPWLIIANEFFDALPVRQFVFTSPSPLAGEGRGGGYQERVITLDPHDQLQFITQPARDLPPSLPSPARGKGIVEYNEAAENITHATAAHIKAQGGAALIADYGYVDAHGDTLQAVKDHRYHDVLQNPGEADLTAHVDFSALLQAARKAGAAAYGPAAQGAFLGKLGAVARSVRLCEGLAPGEQKTIMSGLKRLLAPDQMGELFKVMCIVPEKHPQPEGF